MKIDKLKKGMIVKNYKELCRLLEVETKTGNSRNSQMKEIERYITYEKQGHKYIIKEIHNKPLDKEDNRSTGNNVAPYIEDTELLLIDLLLCSDNEEIKIPTTALLEVLKIVNDNYRKYLYDKRLLLSKELNIDITFIDDYYNNVGSMLNSNIKTVINRLVKKKLIYHKEIIMLKMIETIEPEYNENGQVKLITKIVTDESGKQSVKYKTPDIKTKVSYKEATTEELRKILKIERKTYLELGMPEDSSYSELYKNGKKSEYDTMLSQRLLSELGIEYRYKSHHMIFNRDDVQQEKHMIMDKVKKETIEYNVNKEVRERILENADRRQERIENDIQAQYVIHFGDEKEKNNKKLLPIHDDYITNYLILNERLIYTKEMFMYDIKRYMDALNSYD